MPKMSKQMVNSKIIDFNRSMAKNTSFRRDTGPRGVGRYFSHRKSSISEAAGSSSSINYDNGDLSRLSVAQIERSNTQIPYCTDIWSEHQMLPRVEAKPFGVPNTRQVLLVQRK